VNERKTNSAMMRKGECRLVAPFQIFSWDWTPFNARKAGGGRALKNNKMRKYSPLLGGRIPIPGQAGSHSRPEEPRPPLIEDREKNGSAEGKERKKGIRQVGKNVEAKTRTGHASGKRSRVVERNDSEEKKAERESARKESGRT